MGDGATHNSTCNICACLPLIYNIWWRVYSNFLLIEFSLLFFNACLFFGGVGGRGRERRREGIPIRLHTVSTEPFVGLDLMNCGLKMWAEIKSQMLNWLRRTEAPVYWTFKSCKSSSHTLDPSSLLSVNIVNIFYKSVTWLLIFMIMPFIF